MNTVVPVLLPVHTQTSLFYLKRGILPLCIPSSGEIGKAICAGIRGKCDFFNSVFYMFYSLFLTLSSFYVLSYKYY